MKDRTYRPIYETMKRLGLENQIRKKKKIECAVLSEADLLYVSDVIFTFFYDIGVWLESETIVRIENNSIWNPFDFLGKRKVWQCILPSKDLPMDGIIQTNESHFLKLQQGRHSRFLAGKSSTVVATSPAFCRRCIIFHKLYKDWLGWYKTVKVVRSPINCNSQNWVFCLYLKTTLCYSMIHGYLQSVSEIIFLRNFKGHAHVTLLFYFRKTQRCIS